jgi:hypothetical protein
MLSRIPAGFNIRLRLITHTPLSTLTPQVSFSLSVARGGHQLVTERGKGALVYECKNTWNRGSFHFLQDSGENDVNPGLTNAVMTIRNDGKIGVGTTEPSYKSGVRGDRIQLKEDASGDWIAMRTDGDVLDFTFSGGHLYFQSLNAGEHIFMNPSTNSNVGVGTTLPTARLHAVGGDYGLKGKGSVAGGCFRDNAGTNHAYLGYHSRGRGISAHGDTMGGAFGNELGDGFAYCGYSNTRIQARGAGEGGRFVDLGSGTDISVAFVT